MSTLNLTINLTISQKHIDRWNKDRSTESEDYFRTKQFASYNALVDALKASNLYPNVEYIYIGADQTIIQINDAEFSTGNYVTQLGKEGTGTYFANFLQDEQQGKELFPSTYVLNLTPHVEENDNG